MVHLLLIVNPCHLQPHKTGQFYSGIFDTQTQEPKQRKRHRQHLVPGLLNKNIDEKETQKQSKEQKYCLFY